MAKNMNVNVRHTGKTHTVIETLSKAYSMGAIDDSACHNLISDVLRKGINGDQRLSRAIYDLVKAYKIGAIEEYTVHNNIRDLVRNARPRR